MVNLELYKIFVVVGNELNITKASEKLNISQPAITKHIKNLEETLGVTLFKRNSRGLIFTEKGENLYNKLKEPINEIIEIDKNFNNDISIIVGSHNHLLNVVFGKSINEFCLKYPNINIDLRCLETEIMLEMLKNKEIDVIFSKKVNDLKLDNIAYIHLGFLNDIFVTNKSSHFANKKLELKDLQSEAIYVPRKYAQTYRRLIKIANNSKLNIKNSSYNTILELTSKRDVLGFLTKEYIDEEALEKNNLIELKTDFKLEPSSFGIYYNMENKKKIKILIEMIRNNFK